MTTARETITANYDAVRARLKGGDSVKAAISAIVGPSSGHSESSLRVAYFAVARERGDTRERQKAPADVPDIDRKSKLFGERLAFVVRRRKTPKFGAALRIMQDNESAILEASVDGVTVREMRTLLQELGVDISTRALAAWLDERQAKKQQSVRGGQGAPDQASSVAPPPAREDPSIAAVNPSVALGSTAGNAPPPRKPIKPRGVQK